MLLRPRIALALLLALLLSGLLYRITPLLLWAYNLERAGRLMDTGLAWPEPRSVDVLPSLQDDAALDDALGHLAAAIRWRPDHSTARARAGEVYAARQAWHQAVEAFETAQQGAPRNPLLALRTALAYERLALSVEQAGMLILPDLATATVDTPSQPIDTPFCDGTGTQSCYIGLTTVSLPFDEMPEGPAFAVDGLFLHPPARLSAPWAINATQPILSFVLGFDPRSQAWGSDGATFVVQISATNEPGEVVYERTVDAATAARGWLRDQVDLSAWAGQRVQLTFHTTGGPAGNTVADWTVWGDLTFTTLEAAAVAQLQPTLRMTEAFRAVGLDSAAMLYRSEMAEKAQRPAEAQRWLSRAATLDSSVPTRLNP